MKESARSLDDLARSIAASPLLVMGDETECPYLPNRRLQNAAFAASALPSGLYQALMDRNFRRSGLTIYRPQCPDCLECRMLRIPVEVFRLSRSQKRCLRRNMDIAIAPSELRPSVEKQGLYARYLALRHSGQMDGSPEELARFLLTTNIHTLEIDYRLENRLVGMGIVDFEPRALSAVYFCYDPALSARSLGVFNILTCIELCRRLRKPHLYLGYYVRESSKMRYKARYVPHEKLDSEMRWRRG